MDLEIPLSTTDAVGRPASVLRRRPAAAGWTRPFRGRAGTQTAVLLGLLLGWELIGRVAQSPLLPPLSAVGASVADLLRTPAFQRDLGVSLMTIAAGFLSALVFGIMLGIAMGRFGTFERLLDPYLNALMSSPMVALIPVIMLLFGLQLTARIVVVFLFSFFVICISTLVGIKNADRALIEMARSFGADDPQVFKRIAIPGALPMIFGGVRLGIGRAVGGVLTAEILMALAGLGYQLAYYGSAFLTSYVYAIVAVITAIALVLNEAIQTAERRLAWWD